VGSDLAIWISFTAIAVTLAGMVPQSRRIMRFRGVFALSTLLILACGLTHLLSVVVLWKPLYWLEGGLKLLTACISLVTAAALPFYLPRIKSTLRQAASAVESERRFLAAMESSLDSFCILESVRDLSGQIVDFRFLYLNTVCARLVNRDAKQIVGRLVCETIPENRTQGFFDLYKQVAETGEPVSEEYPVTIESVNAAWLKLQVVKLDDGVAITISDITERKRREEAIAENERRFLTAVESNQDSFCILDSVRDASGEIVDFRFSFVNSIGARLISRTPDEVVGRLISELIPENRPAGLFDQYRQVVETGEPRVDEFPLDFQGVTASWVKCQIVKLDDGVAVTTTDISEQRRREEALAENERRFVAATESSLDCFYIFESVREAGHIVDFRFSYVNGVGARLINLEPSQIVGQRLSELVPGTEGLLENYKHVVETAQAYTEELLLNLKTVNATWMKLQAVKLDDGVAVTATDISERKRLEMERTRAFTESLIENSPAAILVTDPDYLVRAINPAATLMLGYGREELIGRASSSIFLDPLEWTELADRLDRETASFVSLDQALFDSGESEHSHAGECIFRRNDSSSVTVQLSVTRLKGKAGEHTGFMITAFDISERKRREDAATSYREQIEAINRSQMMIEFELDGTIIHANDNYTRVFGYDDEDLSGKHHSVFVPEPYRSSAEYRQFWERLRLGEFQFGEFRRIGKDGREVWVSASYNPIFGPDGAPAKVLKFATDITERIRIQGQFRDAESRLRAILDNVADGIISIDAAGTIVSVNPAGARMFEYAAEELIGCNVRMLMPEPDRGNHDGHLARYHSTGKTKVVGVGRELVGLTRSGRTFPMELTITEVTLRGERLFVGLVRDITERKRAEQEALRAQAFRESLIENSPAAVIATGADHVIVAVNPAAQKMLWYKPDELIGIATPLIFYDQNEVDLLAQRLSTEADSPVSHEDAIFSAAQDAVPRHNGEWTFLRKGGLTLSVQVTVTELRSDRGELTGFMITAYDVSERKRREEYISHLAHHDVLTGLPTRQLLLDRLDMMLSRSQRYGSKCALFMIDLNNFKQVNDSFGHHVGDRLLVQVSERLRSSVRAMDTVARMGGDEFVLLVSDLDSDSSAELVAQKLLTVFETPFSPHDQKQFLVTASIGVCVYPTGAVDASGMLRNADLAMYHAKAAGRHSYQIFTEEIASMAQRQREIENALRSALDDGEFHLQYQPQFSLLDGSLVGVEALLRWNSRQFGPVPPDRFIPIAEQSGLILPIGAWVIQTACREARRFRQRFGHQLMMAVNLSARQIEQPDLLQVVERALAANEIAPAFLEIEITESMLMNDSPSAAKFFDGLRSLGVRVAIDDFGTGFSSMSYLLRFSVDRLKIDRCFIQDACTNPASAAVTSAVIALAHQLKVSVVAEGVETQDQMKFLKAVGCDDVQGYLLGRPLPPDQVLKTSAVRIASPLEESLTL
jgi:diguanylate cyclase (GGDEF)-like protein/PAS domain S-box-containing protein